MRAQFSSVSAGENFHELMGEPGKELSFGPLCYKLREPENINGQFYNARRCADGEPKVFLATDEVDWIQTIML